MGPSDDCRKKGAGERRGLIGKLIEPYPKPIRKSEKRGNAEKHRLSFSPSQRSEYLLDLGFAINDIHEHVAVGFSELLEFLVAFEVSDANHLN